MTELSNGILARVPGDFIAQGSKHLPAAGPAEQGEPVRHVVLDQVPHLGAVRLTYELNWYRPHGRTKQWHWRAKRAEQIPPG